MLILREFSYVASSPQVSSSSFVRSVYLAGLFWGENVNSIPRSRNMVRNPLPSSSSLPSSFPSSLYYLSICKEGHMRGCLQKIHSDSCSALDFFAPYILYYIESFPQQPPIIFAPILNSLEEGGFCLNPSSVTYCLCVFRKVTGMSSRILIFIIYKTGRINMSFLLPSKFAIH